MEQLQKAEKDDPNFVENLVDLIDKTSHPDYIFKTRLLEDMVELDSHDDESIYEACMGDDYVAQFQ